MGKASSSKKVARAAGISGSRTYHRQPPWRFYGVIALIVILGIVGTVTSRDRRLTQINKNGASQQPLVGTVWHEGYAVYECGKFAPAISTKSPDPEGITTRLEGVILIAPNTKSAAGKNATLGKFASAVGMKLNAAELQVPGGKHYQDGDSCQGKPGHVYVKQYNDAGDKTGQLYNGAKRPVPQLPRLDPRNVPLSNQALLVIAFVPSSEQSNIPLPPPYVYTNLQSVAAQSTTATTTTLPPITVPRTTPTTARPSTSTTKR
jgi:hypothetical protein